MYKMFIKYIQFKTVLFSMLIVTAILQAGTTGKLAGKVTIKDSGEPMIGANVLINDTDLGTATDAEGNYYILQVPPGKYSIRFTMIGYQDLLMKIQKYEPESTKYQVVHNLNLY